MDTEWSLINILKALYHLSVSDKLKYDIYFRNGLNKCIRVIIYNGNDVEREYSVLLLWQLCFDKQIATDVLNDSDLYNYINALSSDTLVDRGLQENAAGLVWVLKNSNNDEKPKIMPTTEPPAIDETTVKSPEPEAPKTPVEAPNWSADAINRKHIMISYNRDSRDLCLAIKAELEKDGFLIWIDVEDISGSSLESMANAIENSVFFILFNKFEKKLNFSVISHFFIFVSTNSTV